ncbi:MAG: hypothetical protein JXA71_08900 [Chitinispirillaceae bacterium]|nr:hypothetical protein [Chitinispirillaceae bacterium]
MISVGTILGMSLVAVLTDRFVLDPGIGKGHRLIGASPFRYPVMLGTFVTGSLAATVTLCRLITNLVLLPLELDYLLILAVFVSIAVVYGATTVPLPIRRPLTAVNRLAGHAAVITALLILPLLETLRLPEMPLSANLLASAVTGIIFTVILIIRHGISAPAAAGTGNSRARLFVQELLIAALILLALQGVAPLTLFNW